jgi:hypothetical protein
MPVRLLPSVEILTVAHLKAHPDVAALVGTRVGTELYAGTQPAVWLSLVTGEERFRNHLAAQLVDVRSYGGTKAQADVLARTVHAAMHAMPGSHAQGIVTAVGATAMPGWIPDEGFSPPRPRYVGTYVVTLHPHPS